MRLHNTQARQAVDELTAEGAVFRYSPANGSLPTTFTYELKGGGNRRRCRAIIVAVKADPLVWAAVLAEIALRTASAT